MQKLLRITTSHISLDVLLKGQLKFLNQYYEVIGVASGEEELKKIAIREGIRTVHIPMEREISLFRDLKSLYLLIKLIHREKPFIVHSNTPKGSLLSMIAAYVCNTPHRIYTVTGLRFETENGIYRWLLILMKKLTCLCATKVIPEGEGVKKILLKENITKKPLKKIHYGNINGVDLKFFDKTPEVYEKAEKLKQENTFTFVFIGRISSHKGINELVNAFNRLSNSDFLHINIRLLLVGSVEKDSSPLLNSTAEIIKNNPNIQLKEGWYEDIRPFLAASDALVFPSYREGFPNVVLQAGAMGLPSIVTDISGCNEIIIDGENGVIIPPKNEEELYNVMKDFITNSEKVKKMAANARYLIKSRYDQKEIWKSILDLYHEL